MKIVTEYCRKMKKIFLNKLLLQQSNIDRIQFQTINCIIKQSLSQHLCQTSPHYIINNKEEMNKEKETSFSWLYGQEPDSLVMLSNSRTVLAKLLKKKVKPLYLWIYRSVTQIVNQQILSICNQSNADFVICKSVTDAQTLLQKKENIEAFCVITNSEDVSEAMNLMRNPKCLEIVQFNINIDENNSEDESFSDISDNWSVSFEQQKIHKIDSPIFKNLKLSSWMGVKIFILENSNALPEFRQLPSFFSDNNKQAEQSDSVSCLMAMLNQNINQSTRNMILDGLRNLKRQINEQAADEQVFSKLKSKDLSANEVLKIYSSNETQFYKVVNNMLRALKSPTELFYIQPFFKDLFNAVRDFGKANTKRQRFWCYRGGLMQQKQVENIIRNVGLFVRNLNFMSTSLSQGVAFVFIKNSFLKIQVQADPQQSQFSFGFKDISRYSEYYSERQILFNPLNNFKVLEVKTCKGVEIPQKEQIYIVLNFGPINIEQMYKQSEQYFDPMLFRLENQEAFRKSLKCQGDALRLRFFEEEALSESLLYWEKYCQICLQLGTSQQVRSKSSQESYENKISMSRESNSSKYYKSLEKKAQILFKQGKFKDAAQLYLRLKNYLFDIPTQYKLEQRIGSLILMAQCLFHLHEFSSALAVYDKCECLLGSRVEVNSILAESVQVRKLYLKASMNKLGLGEQAYETLKSIVEGITKRQKYINGHCIDVLVRFCHVSYQRKNFKAATNYFRQCLTILSKIYDENHSAFSTTLSMFGDCLYNMGDVFGAIQIYERCKRIYLQNRPPPKTFVVASNFINYANALFSQGDYQSSLAAYSQCAALARNKLGRSDSNFLISVMGIAFILFKVSLKYEKSLSLLKYCQHQICHLYGPNNSLRMKAVSWIAAIQTTLKEQKRRINLLKTEGKFLQVLNHQSKTNCLKGSYLSSVRFGRIVIKSCIDFR